MDSPYVVLLLFILLFSGFFGYFVYDTLTMTPQEYCEAVFFPRDAYFVTGTFQDGKVTCTYHNTEIKTFNAIKDKLGGIHVYHE